ncbi:MAG: ECF-type sigma factor [Phycisphaerales bacterium]
MGTRGTHSGDQDGPSSAGEVTLLLEAARAGAADAQEKLLALVYDELKKIAAGQMRGERQDHTLGATALVSESYVRLFRSAGSGESLPYGHRRAFYQAAATAMRRILVDHARSRGAVKRGGRRRGLEIDVGSIAATTAVNPEDLLSLDGALVRLEGEDERAALVVRLRFYGGRQLEEVAELLGVNVRTVKRDWEFARARLQELIESEPE